MEYSIGDVGPWGCPLTVSMLLDIVEVVHLHLGLNLAAAFAKILDDFRISEPVTMHQTMTP